MRIGLVLFGHLRSFRAAHDSYKKFLSTLQQVGDVDVFCHTWDIEESVTASWWKEHKPGDIPPATVNATEIEERFKPVRYTIEPSRQFDDSGYNVQSTIPVAGILSMLHSQREAFRLLEEYSKENDVSYDVIIKSRYDLLYEIGPSFSSSIGQCIDDNCLVLPTSNPYELAGSFSDVFVMGPAKLIKEYFGFADDLKSASDSYISKGYAEFLPELCLTSFLTDKAINLHEMEGLRIHILRMNGDKFQINSDKNFQDNRPLCFFDETINSNKKILGTQSPIIEERSRQLAKKYIGWIDDSANDALLQQYADLYSGKWIPVSSIKRLSTKGKNNRVFNSHVMKNFLEESLHNATYSTQKKLMLVSILTIFAGYGSFFLRVLKNIRSKNSI